MDEGLVPTAHPSERDGNRSSIYYRPKGASEENLSLMMEMDRQYRATPFYGSRRMWAWLNRQGLPVSRKRVQRLMRVMGLRAIYRSPRTSHPAPQRRVYPYLLRKAKITRPNQVWAADSRRRWLQLPGQSPATPVRCQWQRPREAAPRCPWRWQRWSSS